MLEGDAQLTPSGPGEDTSGHAGLTLVSRAGLSGSHLDTRLAAMSFVDSQGKGVSFSYLLGF